MFPGSILAGLLMGGKNLVFFHPIIIEEPISSFNMIPSPTGLGDGGGRLLTKFLSNTNQAFNQASVSQGDISKFDLCPSFA